MVAAVDVGTSKICTLIGRSQGEGIEILGIGLSASQGIRKGKVVNVERTTLAIRDSLALAMEVARREPNVIVAGVSGDAISSFNIENEVLISRASREITEREMEKVVESSRSRIPGEQIRIIHLIPQSFSVDDQHGIADPQGMVGSSLGARIHVVTAQESHIQNLHKCFLDSGLEVANFIFQPYACAQSVLTSVEKEAGTLLVDIGGGTTDMAMFFDGSIWFSGVIPLGGEHLTADLSVGLRTSRDEAEKIKLKYGSVFSKLVSPDEMIEVKDMSLSSLKTIRRKFACEIIEARIKELFLLLRRQIKASGMERYLRGGVVLTGGSSLLEGINDFASTMLDLPVRGGYPDGRQYIGMVQTISNPIFSTACGLLEQALSAKGSRKKTRPFIESSFGRAQKMFDWLRDFFMMG